VRQNRRCDLAISINDVRLTEERQNERYYSNYAHKIRKITQTVHLNVNVGLCIYLITNKHYDEDENMPKNTKKTLKVHLSQKTILSKNTKCQQCQRRLRISVRGSVHICTLSQQLRCADLAVRIAFPVLEQAALDSPVHRLLVTAHSVFRHQDRL